MCRPCQKVKAKCKKSSGHSGKGNSESKDKEKAPGKWSCNPHGQKLDQSIVCLQPKLCKKALTCKTIEVSDNKEHKPGLSKVKGKHKVSMLDGTEGFNRVEEWALVVLLQSQVHNTISWICGMEGNLVGIMKELAELKEAMVDK